MSDFVALAVVRGASEDVLSARPDAPVVDDGWSPRPARRSVRRSLASTLRSAAQTERRWPTASTLSASPPLHAADLAPVDRPQLTGTGRPHAPPSARRAAHTAYLPQAPDDFSRGPAAWQNGSSRLLDSAPATGGVTERPARSRGPSTSAPPSLSRTNHPGRPVAPRRKRIRHAAFRRARQGLAPRGHPRLPRR